MPEFSSPISRFLGLSSRSSVGIWFSAVGVWLALIAGGFWILFLHAFTPGLAGVAPGSWPMNSAVVRPAAPFTLMVAAHPECPCSRATIAELAALMATTSGQLSAVVLVLDEPGLPESAERSELWRQAARIPGVTPIRDGNGSELKKFGAATSGETRLYGPKGELVFHGGITGSRGHVGDNPGETAIRSSVNGDRLANQPRSTPVFGCALFDASESPAS